MENIPLSDAVPTEVEACREGPHADDGQVITRQVD